MRTHVKEALASLVGALAIISVIHAGIWFTMFGTPDFEVLGFPFHYFWFVAGGPMTMFVLYWLYYQYITRAIQPEKDDMFTRAEREPGAAAPDGGQELAVETQELTVETGDVNE